MVVSGTSFMICQAKETLHSALGNPVQLEIQY